jgi:hypothetical protein
MKSRSKVIHIEEVVVETSLVNESTLSFGIRRHPYAAQV